MASSYSLTDAPKGRVKRLARPTGRRVDPQAVVADMYDRVPKVMAHLAE